MFSHLENQKGCDCADGKLGRKSEDRPKFTFQADNSQGKSARAGGWERKQTPEISSEVYSCWTKLW